MTLSKEAKRKLFRDIMKNNEKIFKDPIPYSHYDGRCDVCGIILNPTKYIKIGARDLCGRRCYESIVGKPFDGFQHTSMNDRDKMRSIVNILKKSKSGDGYFTHDWLEKSKYSHYEGRCDICGTILNEETFIKLGAGHYCSPVCYDEIHIQKFDGFQHTTIEDRQRMRVIVSQLKRDKNGNQTVTFSEEEVYPNKKKTATVPDLSKDVHEIDMRTAEAITGVSHKSDMKPGTDSWFTYQCDPELMILGARELIDRYLSNLSKLEVYRKTLNEITDNVNSVEEPVYLEDISEWPNYINNKKSLEELGKQQTEDLKKDIDKLLKENDQLGHLMYYSNEIPNKKWIRSGNQGINIGTDGRTINIDIKKWEYIKRLMEPPITKKDEKNKVAIPSKAKEIAHIGVMSGFLIMIFFIAPVAWIGITGSYWGIVAGLVTNFLFYLASRVDY